MPIYSGSLAEGVRAWGVSPLGVTLVASHLHDHVQRVEDMMDNRLAPSSMSRVMTSLRKWDDYCESRGWPTLMDVEVSSRTLLE